jgi:hypothetical protein
LKKQLLSVLLARRRAALADALERGLDHVEALVQLVEGGLLRLDQGQLLAQALVGVEAGGDLAQLLVEQRVGPALLLDLGEARVVGGLELLERGHHRLDGLLDLDGQGGVVGLLALDARAAEAGRDGMVSSGWAWAGRWARWSAANAGAAPKTVAMASTARPAAIA